eukprot:scaffold1501_cov352-Pavlova_lutheri.AAC.35
MPTPCTSLAIASAHVNPPSRFGEETPPGSPLLLIRYFPPTGLGPVGSERKGTRFRVRTGPFRTGEPESTGNVDGIDPNGWNPIGEPPSPITSHSTWHRASLRALSCRLRDGHGRGNELHVLGKDPADTTRDQQRRTRGHDGGQERRARRRHRRVHGASRERRARNQPIHHAKGAFACEMGRERTAGRRSSRLTGPPQSKRNTPGRLELMKYNKYLRRHTLHREIKKK